jgi:hypothetical protein
MDVVVDTVCSTERLSLVRSDARAAELDRV